MGGRIKRAARPREKQVGVRDLKTHAARILRDVRESRSSVVVTHRGRAIGMILPLDAEAGADGVADTSSPWETFLQAGRRLEIRFKAGRSGVRLLSDMRR